MAIRQPQFRHNPSRSGKNAVLVSGQSVKVMVAPAPLRRPETMACDGKESAERWLALLWAQPHRRVRRAPARGGAPLPRPRRAARALCSAGAGLAGRRLPPCRVGMRSTRRLPVLRRRRPVDVRRRVKVGEWPSRIDREEVGGRILEKLAHLTRSRAGCGGWRYERRR